MLELVARGQLDGFWGSSLTFEANVMLVPLSKKHKKTSRDLACIARWQSSLEGLRVTLAKFETEGLNQERQIAHEPALRSISKGLAVTS